ncbi:MAG TPA: hypothetical protein VMS17_19830 [Gemmataceae bacterium]|nr:hypothetical protein [Gemmataceae bacterium]
MSPNAPTAPAPIIPADVSAFAAEHGVAEYVAPLLEMTRSAFSGAPVTVHVEEDAEEYNVRWIVFLLDVTGWDADRLFKAREEWVEGLMRICPSTQLRYFTMGMWASA